MYLSSVLDFNSDLSSIQKSKLMKEKESVFPPYFFRPFISLQRWENFNFWEKIRSFFLHGESQEDKKKHISLLISDAKHETCKILSDSNNILLCKTRTRRETRRNERKRFFSVCIVYLNELTEGFTLYVACVVEFW